MSHITNAILLRKKRLAGASRSRFLFDEPLGIGTFNMEFLDIIAILLTLAAFFAYVNHKLFKLPMAIGVMLMGLVASLLVLLVGGQFEFVKASADRFIQGIDFNETLMEGMLSYLLFAGALHVSLKDLAQQKWIVSIMASFGVMFSTFVVGTIAYFLFKAFGIEVHYMWCYV